MSAMIEFKAPTEFLGRNGQAKMVAILIDRLDNDITLVPITSRRQMGRAYMLVPKDMVPAVARAMLQVSGNRQKVVVSVRGGVAELVSCPPGVSVRIVDHDNLAAEQEDRRRRVA